MPLFAELYAQECAAVYSVIGAICPQLAVLPDKSEETPAATLAALWFWRRGKSVSTIAACQTTLLPLSLEEETRVQQLMSQRLTGVPWPISPIGNILQALS